MPKAIKSPVSKSPYQLVRVHPTNPIDVRPVADAAGSIIAFTVHTPRWLHLRGLSINRLDVNVRLVLPPGVCAHLVAIQPHAHEKGYTVDGGLMVNGSEVSVFIRNHTQRTVNFEEGAAVAMLVFGKLMTGDEGEFTLDLDVRVPEKKKEQADDEN